MNRNILSPAARLNCNDSEGEPVYVQMVTALVFQLIQCVVQLPSERDPEEEHKKKVAACSTHQRDSPRLGPVSGPF